jgi:hypothetical protein
MASLVRLAAVAAAAFVALSFLLFAEVGLRDGSKGQIERIDGAPASKKLEADVQRPNPVPSVERVRESNSSSLREQIEDVNDVLVSPFTGYTDFESAWGERLLVLLLGLLLYGGGGLLLANFFPKHKSTAGDWREATS